MRFLKWEQVQSKAHATGHWVEVWATELCPCKCHGLAWTDVQRLLIIILESLRREMF